jgi:two-component system cell cycle sensor histidine kinase/response regulator CckA
METELNGNVREDQMMTSSPLETHGEAGRSRTILLVEDEAFVRDVLDEVLRSAGYRVLKTQTAEEALELYPSICGELDLLLTDVVMPGQSGRELARNLRAQCPGMRTIFMSGYGESVALLGADRDASVFYLSKPFSLPGLLKKVEQVLN